MKGLRLVANWKAYVFSDSITRRCESITQLWTSLEVYSGCVVVERQHFLALK